MAKRDIVVVGASMGGIEALLSLAERLPSDLAASMLVVQHTSPQSPSALAGILDKRGPLHAVVAEDGMRPQHGHIYVAPPNRHMLLTTSGIRVAFGARENRARPSIDPLFRTSAVNHRSRVIGIVLTGLLGDGSAGLTAIDRCGGLAIVQDPDEAEYPEMPRNALAAVPGARRVTLREIPELLAELVRSDAPEPPPVPHVLMVESAFTEKAMSAEDGTEISGKATNYTCPDCHGAIQVIEDSTGVKRYRCRVGHAYSAEDMLGGKLQAVEDTLWMALQTLQERAQMLGEMANDDRSRGRERSAIEYDERAEETREHAARLRDLLGRVLT